MHYRLPARFTLLFQILLFIGTSISAEPYFSSNPPLLGNKPTPLVNSTQREQVASENGSLFSGKQYFLPPQASKPRFETPPQQKARYPHGIKKLKDIIAQAEAGPAGYDAVVYSARIKPNKKPSQMSIKEIYDWISKTPRQNHAIGRYQFIPKTLKRLVKATDTPLTAKFSPEVQDMLAMELFKEAGIQDFLKLELSQKKFMHNLSKIWAGLPSATGKSYYHGYAGNKATMSWNEFNHKVSTAFAASQRESNATTPLYKRENSRSGHTHSLPARANF